MSRPSRTSDDVDRLLESSGFTPALHEVPALLERLAEPDEAKAKLVLNALLRAGPAVGPMTMARFLGTKSPARARMVTLIGRLAVQTCDAGMTAFLREHVNDEDPKSRRRAVAALGRLAATLGATSNDDSAPGDVVFAELESTLVQVLASAHTTAEQKVAVEALGKVGGDAARTALRSIAPQDAELERVVREARIRLERSATRGEPSAIDLDRVPPHATTVLLHVRAGLEPLLLSELDPSMRPQVAGRGRVILELDRPLRALFAARTFLHFGFPIPPALSGLAPDDAACAALTSKPALAIFRTFTRGSIRYRIEWRGQGHRRAATYRLAEAVARVCPELINDPRDATWEAGITARDKSVWVELWPRGYADPRFAYRVRTVSASSHPTIAAAIARFAGAQPNDVVWDPFVGAGAELVERSLLGPYRNLYGSDISREALDAARANLETQGLQASLQIGDAREYRPPEPVSIVVTNPPMGRRLIGPGAVDALLDQALKNVVGALVRGGRMAWMAPHAERSCQEARRLGLTIEERIRVDMGGFEAELQLFRKTTKLC